MYAVWVLGDEGAVAEVFCEVCEVVGLAEVVDVAHEFFFGESCEGVFEGG